MMLDAVLPLLTTPSRATVGPAETASAGVDFAELLQLATTDELSPLPQPWAPEPRIPGHQSLLALLIAGVQSFATAAEDTAGTARGDRDGPLDNLNVTTVPMAVTTEWSQPSSPAAEDSLEVVLSPMDETLHDDILPGDDALPVASVAPTAVNTAGISIQPVAKNEPPSSLAFNADGGRAPVMPVTVNRELLPGQNATGGEIARTPETTPGTAVQPVALPEPASGIAPGTSAVPPGNGGGTAPVTTGQPVALQAPLATPDWGRELGQRMVIAVRGEEQRVSLHLNPAELGPLQVKLKIVDQQAQIQLLSPHALVRNAVEQAIPQLRETLAEQGITLADASVNDHHREEHPRFTGSAPGHSHGDEEGDAPAEDKVTTPITAPVDGHVNIYV